MKYDDETLMAYADGELDEVRFAEISAAIEQDPELARRVAQHRALRTEVAGAYASVLDQPVPGRLHSAARGPRGDATFPAATPARDARPRGNVVQFPARGSRAPGAPWRAREWTAIAASLVLGGFISWQFLTRSAGDITSRGGALVASGELAQALDVQLASNQPDDASVRIGLSFKAKDGSYCRSFVSRGASAAGLACRDGGQWRISTTDSLNASGDGLRQASSPAMLQAIEARMAGEALDSAGEKAARDAGWK